MLIDFLIALVIFAVALLLLVWLAEQDAAPTVSAARDIEPTPDERGDYGRLSNPARRPKGLTLAQIVAKARDVAEAEDAAVFSAQPIRDGYVPEEPDEDNDDENSDEPYDDEPEPAPAVAEVIPTFTIQGEPTDEALTYAELAAAWPVTEYSKFDSTWNHSGMTGYAFRVEDLEAEIARHDAAQVLTDTAVSA